MQRLLRSIPEVEAVDLEHGRLGQHPVVNLGRHLLAGGHGDQAILRRRVVGASGGVHGGRLGGWEGGGPKKRRQ